MKIAFFDIEGWEEEIVRKNFLDDEIFISKGMASSLVMPHMTEFETISVFINSKIDKAVLDMFPTVRCISTRSTGYDHIDIEECKKRGVTVLYVPGYGDNTVAEYTFGLLLSLIRKIYQGIDQIKETGSFSLQGLRGEDLKGKTIGVIGTGRIGKEVIKIAKGFGMYVVAYDPYPDKQFALDAKIAYHSFEEVLKTADVITFHCPYTKETHHLLNKRNISLLKHGVYLVNTARGGIIETEALVAALEGGILKGAALDVIEEEGETKDELSFLASAHPREEELVVMLRNHMLMKMPNVLITPHNAFNSQEALMRILGTTIDNVKSFIANAPQNVVR